MLKVSFLELILRGIPEGLLFFLGIYALTKKAVKLDRYLLSSLLFSTGVYVIRFLPINHQADSILNLIMLIVLAAGINKFEIIETIKASIITMLIGFVCEGVNVFIIQFVMKKDLNMILNDPVLKVLYSSPSLLIFGCIVAAYYIRLWKRKELKYISYGKAY